MNAVNHWLCIGAIGVAGFALVELSLHAHGDELHLHTHVHRHGGLIHTHYHWHGADAGHEPLPDSSAGARPCGGDEHHCCVDRCPSDGVHFTLPPRETRRLSKPYAGATQVDVTAGASFMLELATPARAPPEGTSSQESLPHLRTVVLLI